MIPNAGNLLTFKIDPAKSGTYRSPDGAVVITIVASEKTFSFTSNVPLEWIIVKGGPGANIYEFTAPTTGASGLVAPRGAGLSHLDFCYPPPGSGGSGGSGNVGHSGGSAGSSGAGSPGSGGANTATGGSGNGGSCPPNYQLWLSTEGASVCTPIPFDGQCPAGYTLDTASEGKFCIPAVPR